MGRSDSTQDVTSQLRGFGFSHDQIINVLKDVHNVKDSEEQLQLALDILLANNADQSISDNENDANMIQQPPKKRRRIEDDNKSQQDNQQNDENHNHKKT